MKKTLLILGMLPGGYSWFVSKTANICMLTAVKAEKQYCFQEFELSSLHCITALCLN